MYNHQHCKMPPPHFHNRNYAIHIVTDNSQMTVNFFSQVVCLGTWSPCSKCICIKAPTSTVSHSGTTKHLSFGIHSVGSLPWIRSSISLLLPSFYCMFAPWWQVRIFLALFVFWTSFLKYLSAVQGHISYSHDWVELRWWGILSLKSYIFCGAELIHQNRGIYLSNISGGEIIKTFSRDSCSIVIWCIWQLLAHFVILFILCMKVGWGLTLWDP